MSDITSVTVGARAPKRGLWGLRRCIGAGRRRHLKPAAGARRRGLARQRRRAVAREAGGAWIRGAEAWIAAVGRVLALCAAPWKVSCTQSCVAVVAFRIAVWICKQGRGRAGIARNSKKSSGPYKSGGNNNNKALRSGCPRVRPCGRRVLRTRWHPIFFPQGGQPPCTPRK